MMIHNRAKEFQISHDDSESLRMSPGEYTPSLPSLSQLFLPAASKERNPDKAPEESRSAA